MDRIFERYHDIVPDFPLFQEVLNKPMPVCLRANGLKIGQASLVRSLKARGILLKKAIGTDNSLYLVPGLSSPGNLLEYFQGYVHPQALTSCLASIVLAPEKDSYVLDMCAAPGGKTSHLAQLMNNSGLIVANELHRSRQVPLGNSLARLGVLNTVVTGYQAQEFPLKQRFDFILADVPCSGEGRFRKIAEGFQYKETRKKEALPVLQKKILLRGFDLLKEDGCMLYSTCTYNPEENESVVNFLLENRDARLLPILTDLDYDEGLITWRDEEYDRQITRAVRFYPHRVNSVGFFMARIGRTG